MQIKHTKTGVVLYKDDSDTIKRAVQHAAKSGANFSGANFSGANFSGANFSGANFSGANLSGANLRDADLNWGSHPLLSEILFNAAKKDMARQRLTAWIGRSTGLCWEDFLKLDDPLTPWALGVLSDYVKDDDAPKCVKEAVSEAP